MDTPETNKIVVMLVFVTNVKTILNLKKFILFGDDSHNIRIYDKDIIVIDKLENPDQSIVSNAVRYRMNPQYVQVIVSGRVNMPGVFKLSRESTLNDAIDLAGGAKILKGKLTFVRFNKNGTIVLFPSWAKHWTDVYERDGERITVAFDIVPHR